MLWVLEAYNFKTEAWEYQDHAQVKSLLETRKTRYYNAIPTKIREVTDLTEYQNLISKPNKLLSLLPPKTAN